MSCASRVPPFLFTVLLTVLLTLALLVAGAPSPAGSAPPLASHQRQRAVVAVLPPIAQIGPVPEDPSAAQTVITARFRPRTVGRPVLLERRLNGAWRTVARARLDDQGRTMFTAARLVAGRPATYRVTAAPYRGLAQHHSTAVRSTAWGAPAYLDTFDGDALGATWEHRIQFHNPWGGRSCSKGDPSAVAVGGGTLRLSVLADPEMTGELCPTYDGAGSYLGDYAYRLNGHVSTEQSFDFLYGVAAARIRFQQQPGQHGAFWMQPRGLLDYAPTPWGAEIDVIEWFGADGDRKRLATTVHRHQAESGTTTTVGGPLPDPDRFLQGRSDRWWRNFHVFSVEWTPDEYIFRIDGKETMRTSEGLSHHPEFLILSMLSSDFELGRLGDANLPQHMDVDWVAAWPQSARTGELASPNEMKRGD